MEHQKYMAEVPGIITPEDQRRIRESSVAIAGIGGIGAIASVLCAKTGFGRVILCDHDQYEVANIVEQYFANYETVGIDKTRAAHDELQKHCDHLKIETIQNEIITQEDADALVEHADYIIAGVDNAKARILIARAARKKQLPLIISANIGWRVFHAIHMPEEPAYEQICFMAPNMKRLKNGQIALEDAKTLEIINLEWLLFAICLGGFFESFVEALLKNEINHYSYMAHPAFFSASFSVNELVKLCTGRGDIVSSPDLFAFDLLKNRPIDTHFFFSIIYKMREAHLNKDIDLMLKIYREHLSQ